MREPARADLKKPDSRHKEKSNIKPEQEALTPELVESETPFLPNLAAHAESLARATSGQRVDLVSQLQRTYGNSYVQRLLKFGPNSGPAVSRKVEAGIVQRAPTGIATAVITRVFATNANTFWKEVSNKDKPLKDLADFLMQKVNEKLPYPCQPVYASSGDTGAFSRVKWTIEMNTSAFSKRGITKVGDLNKDEVADIVDTIYHEARHAEQAFRIAQMKAKEGKTAQQIVTAMSIPAVVAAAAANNPLQGSDETKGWEAFMVGKYETYKGQVASLRDQINDMRDELGKGRTATKITRTDPKITRIKTHLEGFFTTEKAKIEHIAHKDAADTSVLRHINEIKAAFDALKTEFDIQKADDTKVDLPKLKALARTLHEARYNAYRDYEHEKDAWATGGAAGTAFKNQAR
jgi:hypothetical protein